MDACLFFWFYSFLERSRRLHSEFSIVPHQMTIKQILEKPGVEERYLYLYCCLRKYFETKNKNFPKWFPKYQRSLFQQIFTLLFIIGKDSIIKSKKYEFKWLFSYKLSQMNSKKTFCRYQLLQINFERKISLELTFVKSIKTHEIRKN